MALPGAWPSSCLCLLALVQEASAVPGAAWFAEVKGACGPGTSRDQKELLGRPVPGGGGWWPLAGQWHASLALSQVPTARFLELCPPPGREQEAEWGPALLELPVVLPLKGWGLLGQCQPSWPLKSPESCSLPLPWDP